LSEPPAIDSGAAEDFAALYESAPVGLLTLRPDGSIIKANATLARWIGQDADVLRGRRLRDLLTLPGKVMYETSLAPLLNLQGGFEEVALDLAAPAGGTVQVLANAAPHMAASGQVNVIHLALFRSPERRYYERELQAREEAARLRLAAERDTAQLREQFIAVLGHDLRNPLAAIVGAARLLRRENLTSKGVQVTELMEASVDRMAGLIDDVMDFARGRLGSGIGLNRELGLLEPVLRQVVAELEASQPSREIILEVDAPELISFDPGRLAQLVSNLVGNALTHGDPKSPVRVKAFAGEKGMELWVANAGEPIPPVALPRLFQPFFRGEVRPSRQGLGLGLHIASEIAKAHGGTLTVSSDSSETCFTLLVPGIEES
jgi:sigma-B regulation protein RsbU (phosphoserine phosphatase)